MNSAPQPDGDSDGDIGMNAVDTGTIGWLLPGIASAFDAATAALRVFRAGAAGVDRADVDLGPLRVARSHLHQAHGALELGELTGATRLTEAIEAFLADFEADPARCDALALDAIIGGCRTIIEYLEDLQGGAPQQPLYLFPSYRELLAARGVDRVHPADLFTVDLTRRSPQDDYGRAIDKSTLRAERSAFEQALLRYIRNEDDKDALARLARAVAAVDASVAATATSAQGQQQAFWWATRGLFEALANDGFAEARAQHTHLKRLAGRVNLQIRKLVDGSGAVAERLFADVLFFVAIAAPVTPRVRDVQAHYRLVGAVPADFETQRYGRIDAGALKTARDHLAAAKSAWSSLVAGDVQQIPDFARHATALLDAVGAIRRPGLAHVAQVIDGIATDLGFDPRQPTAAVGLDVATALLFLEGALDHARSLDESFDARAALVVARVETSVLGQDHGAQPVDWLDRMSREAEERLTVATFVTELQANLRSAEKELDAFFREPAARGGLADAQKALAQASGALALLGHGDVHAAIDHASETIGRFQRYEIEPEVATFDALAQSLGAVGFYVEQIRRDRIDTAAFHFDRETGQFSATMARPAGGDRAAVEPTTTRAEPTVAAAISASGLQAERPAEPVPYSDIAFAATQVLDTEATLEEEIAHRAADAADHATRLRAGHQDRQVLDQLASAVDDVRRNAALIDDRGLQDQAAGVLAAVRGAGHAPLVASQVAEITANVHALVARANRSVGAPPPAAAPLEPLVAVPSSDNHDAIDAELLEIFLEEAGEVLVDATSSLRVLDADPINATATVNLRRGFHTLKGSSRMVGLMAFGDASWAVEETLNGHIADQGAASTDLRALIDYAIRYMSGWVDELRQTGTSSRYPDALIEAARAVRSGASPLAFAKTEIIDDTSDGGTADAGAFSADASLHFPDLVEDSTIDRAFAATEVIGDEPATDFAFTVDPPHAVEDDLSNPRTPEIVDLDLPMETFDALFEMPVDAASDGAADADVDAPVDGDAADATIPAETGTSSLDWLEIPGDAVSAAEETRDASTPVVPFDAMPVESIDMPLPDEADTAGVAAAVPNNVVAFAMRQPAPADDVRQIGPLTLSVALFNIYLSEADELLRVLTQDFAEWQHELDRFVSERAMRAAHSLAGSSATVGLVPAHDLAAAIEEMLVALYRSPIEMTVDQVRVLGDAVESLRRMLHRFAAERIPDPDPVRLAGLLALNRAITGVDDSTTSAAGAPVAAVDLPFEALDFGEGRTENIDDVDAETTAESALDGDPAASAVVDGEHAFDTANVDAANVEADLSAGGTVEQAHGMADDSSAAQTSDHATEAVAASDERMPESVASFDTTLADAVAADAIPDRAELHDVAHDAMHVDAAASDVPASDVPASDVTFTPAADDVDEPSDEPEDDEVAEPFVHDALTSLVAAADDDALAASRRAAATERVTAVADDIDPELLEVFVEEGNEILPQIGTLLRTWQAHRDNPAPSRTLLRHLHTLKGSARMAGAMRLGEVVHEIEARVESAARLSEVPAPLIDELLAAHDRSLELFDRVQHPATPQPVASDTTAVESADTTGAADDATMSEPFMPDAVPMDAAAAPRKQASHQVVRVNAETLDRLVNLAGEVSISRARIENEVLQIKDAMSDLSENVDRLRGQLREIELQAEFQMQSQMQSHQAAAEVDKIGDKFDPLEFDRFTRFQELTRMMAESVNDVKTVQQNLQKSLDVAEADLTSQRRMTRDLQQDLMAVRMVPFASISERLYRVARRTAKELDKRVNLDIRGGSVEIDRSVLERMAGPFEHLLRNHIVHGIETRDARRAVGKSETGELLVEIRQEGNEIALTFSDDGAGLDLGRIRAKGRELGLIGDGDVGDAQAIELIFHPGFSTAAEVTELAGRGVGLDVVRAEAVELAGRVTVDSEPGHGTRFSINLPLTLAVTQVVLVAVASRVYALPAVLVEQVQQMRQQPLAEAYRAGHLDVGGSAVRIAFLGTLLGIEDVVPVAQRTSPVLVLRSAGERVAIHVDEVVGNQEVVVKNLGPQLARMTGIAGATVLGSGEIVLILNPVPLALAERQERRSSVPAAGEAGGSAAAVVAEGGLKTLPTVMVVDDSLTVRRVTQRLLSREGYQVVLAKDGVDALEQLQDYPPDVMLVDIEMPRMDGFDLTRNVRNDERYRTIPIIMITSRTAEKHRRHAAELGVDAYLGKPYQEDELLDLLAMHVQSKRGQTA